MDFYVDFLRGRAHRQLAQEVAQTLVTWGEGRARAPPPPLTPSHTPPPPPPPCFRRQLCWALRRTRFCRKPLSWLDAFTGKVRTTPLPGRHRGSMRAACPVQIVMSFWLLTTMLRVLSHKGAGPAKNKQKTIQKGTRSASCNSVGGSTTDPGAWHPGRRGNCEQRVSFVVILWLVLCFLWHKVTCTGMSWTPRRSRCKDPSSGGSTPYGLSMTSRLTTAPPDLCPDLANGLQDVRMTDLTAHVVFCDVPLLC